MNKNKDRHTVWLTDEAWDKVKDHYRTDNCSTQNEYIEKAIQFYSGYLDAEQADSYLPRVLAEVLEGKLGALGGRIGKLLFKLSTEEAIIGDMLDYLDGYPLALPARYANRQACFETVYIISNIDLREQYPNIQGTDPATWRAFLRRIHRVVEYRKEGEPIDHGPALDYIFPPPPPEPEWVREAREAKQIEIG